MARIRTIKPEFFTSDDVCALSPLARLLYIGLWCEADREGRMVWAPKAFKRRYLPEDDCDVERLCEELRDAGLVVMYGDTLAHIPTFSKHQHVNPREAASVLDPPKNDASGTRSDASVTRREEGKEGEGKERKERKVSRASAEKSPISKDWKPTEEQLAYAREQGCPDPLDTAERFRLHHVKTATKHADWHAAFQYWCRNEKNFARPANSPRRPEPGLPMSHNDTGQWRARVLGWTPGRFWNRGDWGPEPGEPGCRVPAPVLAEWQAGQGGNA